MFTLRSSSSSFRKSPLALALGLIAGLATSVSLSACKDDGSDEVCYEELPADSDTDEICGTTMADRALMTSGRASNLHSACFPLDSCPNYCPADQTNASSIAPHFEDENPDAEYDEVIPLCVQLDVAAGNCCFWALFVEPS
jgi:hypothetical protein